MGTQINKDFTTIITAAMDKREKEFMSQVRVSTPADEVIHKSGMTKESGGPLVIVPVEIAMNTNAHSYALFGAIKDDPQETLTVVNQNRRYMSVALRIHDEEEALASGPEEVVPLLAHRIDNAIASLIEFRAQAYWDLPGVADANSPDPFTLMVHHAPTTSVSFMNVDPSLQTWWRNQQTTSSASTFKALLKETDSFLNLMKRLPGGKDLFGICDYSTFELYGAARRAEATGSVRDPDFLHDNIRYGSFTVFPDQHVPDAKNQVADVSTNSKGTLYAFSKKSFRIEYLRGLRLKQGPWVFGRNDTARNKKILLSENLVAMSRRLNGVFDNIDLTIAA